MKIVRNIFVFVALIAGAVLCWVNVQDVSVNYLFGQLEVPLIIVLITMLLIGFLLAYIAMLPRAVSRRAELQKLKRKLHESDQEVRNLRNLPIQDA